MYLHMVHTSGAALSKKQTLWTEDRKHSLFFYVNLFPPTLNFIAKSLQDDTPVKQAEILAQTRPCTI